MILKSIELFGFKSFADRTVIEFRDGISAIVGPNGCGKSNILDAIRWVLGEQATKNLRANRMEDVIFSGTEQRKPLNVAEVSLVLGNENNLFPLEMSEIVVKRRIYRNGENEYFINNTPVKLKEVRELFFDTGIGKAAYSLMEQGKIDQILSTKPEERRYIFEEAAGITSYKVKNMEAEKKLERTEENIRQIEGILAEIKRSHDTLKAQSEKTTIYRQLNEKLFTIELDLQLLRLKSFIAEQEKREKELSGNASSRDTIKADIDEINTLLEKNIDLVNNMENHLIEIQKKLYGIDIEKNNKSAQIKILQERGEDLKQKIKFDEGRKNSTMEKKGLLVREQEEKKNSLQRIKVDMQTIEENIKSFEHDIELALYRIKENDELKAKLVKTNSLLEAEIDKQREELRSLTDAIVTELDRRLKETGYSALQRLQTEKQIEELLATLKIQVAGKGELLADAQKLKGLSIEGINSLAQAFKEFSQKITDVENLFKRYRETAATFLDEFIAPEGIITKKRAIDDAINQTSKQIALNRNTLLNLQTENEALGKKIDEYKNTLSELKVNQATLDTTQQALTNDCLRLAREIAEQEKLLTEIDYEIAQTQKAIADLGRLLFELEQQRLQAEDEEKALKGKLLELEKEIEEKNKLLLNKEKLLKSKIEELEKMQEKVERIQMILAEINTEIRSTNENFKERFGRDLWDYQQRMQEINNSPDELKKEYASVKEAISKLGQINLLAPEEYQEVKERFEFLTNQLQDLQKAKSDLLEITKKIREESTRRFEETYNQIKKNFHNTFRILFGGGRAELKLTDPQDFLQSGVEIFAQPPGKKLESIAMLSGGERTLTAIALLFAIYKVKPSPFCILDEIDAALDDKNIGQFINMLAEFKANTQFLIITHNKKTVTSANCLLGITMEESGVSKLVTFKLKDEEKSPAQV